MGRQRIRFEGVIPNASGHDRTAENKSPSAAYIKVGVPYLLSRLPYRHPNDPMPCHPTHPNHVADMLEPGRLVACATVGVGRTMDSWIHESMDPCATVHSIA